MPGAQRRFSDAEDSAWGANRTKCAGIHGKVARDTAAKHKEVWALRRRAKLPGFHGLHPREKLPRAGKRQPRGGARARVRAVCNVDEIISAGAGVERAEFGASNKASDSAHLEPDVRIGIHCRAPLGLHTTRKCESAGMARRNRRVVLAHARRDRRMIRPTCVGLQADMFSLNDSGAAAAETVGRRQTTRTAERKEERPWRIPVASFSSCNLRDNPTR